VSITDGKLVLQTSAHHYSAKWAQTQLIQLQATRSAMEPVCFIKTMYACMMVVLRKPAVASTQVTTIQQWVNCTQLQRICTHRLSLFFLFFLSLLLLLLPGFDQPHQASHLQTTYDDLQPATTPTDARPVQHHWTLLPQNVKSQGSPTASGVGTAPCSTTQLDLTPARTSPSPPRTPAHTASPMRPAPCYTTQLSLARAQRHS
jgi:hypothetical protein